MTATETIPDLQKAADLFKLLSDHTRLHVLIGLSKGERHVGSLCEVVGMSRATISRHLVLLKQGGLARAQRRSQHNFYALTPLGATLAELVKGYA